MWKKGQLAADDDDENEDPNAILTADNLSKAALCAREVTNTLLDTSLEWLVDGADKKVCQCLHVNLVCSSSMSTINRIM